MIPFGRAQLGVWAALFYFCVPFVEALGSQCGYVIPWRRNNPIPGASTVSAGTAVGKSRSRLLRATITFTGESSTSIFVPPPSSNSAGENGDDANDDKSLPAWMLSEESDVFFLGTRDFKQGSDGNWEAFQASVEWFGLQLVPVFVIKLERSRSKQYVSAIIQRARNEIKSGRDSALGRLVAPVMEMSSFQGGNKVSWKECQESDGWILKADLSLTLSIPLPPLLPLPPGFNSIGSRIVESTCKRRLKTFVNDLQTSYLDWAENQS